MIQKSDYQGPLAGLNVIDIGHYYAGPMAAMTLADQGANVIRIVKPGKPELPEPQYRLYNRNKKLLEIDLKAEAGKQQALSLIERADVVIENFRPGVMKRLGLDYASVKDRNPGLIYLSLPGFASTDGERAHVQAWEGILGAGAGLYVEGNIFRKPLGYPPAHVSIPICSSYGAVHGVVAVMAALLAREKSGVGTKIEVPLVDAGLSSCTDRHILGILGASWQQPQWLRAVYDPTTPLPDVVKPFTYSRTDNQDAQLKKLSGVWGNFYSSDLRKMFFVLAKPWHAERFYNELGIYDQLLEEGYVNRGAWDRSSKGNNLTSWMTGGYAQRIGKLTSDIIKTKTAEEWEEIMARIGVPFSMTRTRNEWLALEPLLKAGLFAKMNDGDSELIVPGRIADISGPGGVLIDTTFKEPVSIAYDDAAELLPPQNAEGALSPSLAVQKKGGLLKDLKVLDLCSIVAGPNASYTLAQYGAEVIRIEPPQVFNSPVHLVCCLEVNQGKRSMILDTKTAPGRKAFEKLVRWADVVVHNRVDDIATRLGVTHAQLQEINPNIIVSQITALGGTQRGCWEGRLGFDNTANMPSGIYANFGSLEYPMSFGGVSADLMSGLGTAFSALLGIYQLRKTGYAGEGRSSLARATNYNQFPWMVSEKGCSDWGEARGQFSMGQYWWARMYQCSDRWIYVEATRERSGVLAETVSGYKDTDENALEIAFYQRDCASWMSILNAVDIACHPVISLDDIHLKEEALHVDNSAADVTIEGPLQSLQWDQHPCGLPVMLPSPSWVRVGVTPTYRRLPPAPRVGAHTKEILAEFGYGKDEIDDLLRLKVAHDYLPVLGDKYTYFFEQVK